MQIVFDDGGSVSLSRSLWFAVLVTSAADTAAAASAAVMYCSPTIPANHANEGGVH